MREKQRRRRTTKPPTHTPTAAEDKFKELEMKRENVKTFLNQQNKKAGMYMVTQRLDESLPLTTNEWTKVEQLLMRLTEFAPNALIAELVTSIADYADDQARLGYVLGQEDLLHELKKRVA